MTCGPKFIKLGPKAVNHTGLRFGSLTALGPQERKASGVFWLCKCDCGKLHSVSARNLVHNVVRSCGCKQSVMGRAIKHGHTSWYGMTPEYKCWLSIKNRCRNKKNYGARGIRVCPRWYNDFPTFLADMGPRPSPHHSIERIDTNGHYEPSNCKWATLVEQANNKRSNVVVTAYGKTQTCAQWARQLGIKRGTLYRRLYKGWTIEAALSTPVGSR